MKQILLLLTIVCLFPFPATAQDQKFTNTAGHTNTTETEYSVFDANGRFIRQFGCDHLKINTGPPTPNVMLPRIRDFVDCTSRFVSA